MIYHSLKNLSKETVIVLLLIFIMLEIYWGIKYSSKIKNTNIWNKLFYFVSIIWFISILDKLTNDYLYSIFNIQQIPFFLMLASYSFFGLGIWADAKSDNNIDKRKRKKRVIIIFSCILLMLLLKLIAIFHT